MAGTGPFSERRRVLGGVESRRGPVWLVLAIVTTVDEHQRNDLAETRKRDEWVGMSGRD